MRDEETTYAVDGNGRHMTPGGWLPSTPGDLVQDLADTQEWGGYFEICPENAGVLLHYIRGLEADSRALTALRQAIDGEALKRDSLERLAKLGAFKLRTYYEAAHTDWRAIYGSAG